MAGHAYTLVLTLNYSWLHCKDFFKQEVPNCSRSIYRSGWKNYNIVCRIQNTSEKQTHLSPTHKIPTHQTIKQTKRQPTNWNTQSPYHVFSACTTGDSHPFHEGIAMVSTLLQACKDVSPLPEKPQQNHCHFDGSGKSQQNAIELVLSISAQY